MPLALPYPRTHAHPNKAEPLQTLQDVRRALHARTGTEEIPKLVNTRVFLRTGVNLMDIKPAQNSDAGLVAKVVTALSDFGHPLS